MNLILYNIHMNMIYIYIHTIMMYIFVYICGVIGDSGLTNPLEKGVVACILLGESSVPHL